MGRMVGSWRGGIIATGGRDDIPFFAMIGGDGRFQLASESFEVDVEVWFRKAIVFTPEV